MWIALNDSFLSIVQHNEYPDVLLVRARRVEDIQALFPNMRQHHTPDADYPYRAYVARSVVADALRDYTLKRLDYTNFKDSVEDPVRHYAYVLCWSDLHLLSTYDREEQLEW